METIGGIPVDDLKNAGLSNEDIEFIREKAAAYNRANQGKLHPTHDRASTRIAFEAGVAIGIARVNGLATVQKKIGF